MTTISLELFRKIGLGDLLLIRQRGSLGSDLRRPVAARSARGARSGFINVVASGRSISPLVFTLSKRRRRVQPDVEDRTSAGSESRFEVHQGSASVVFGRERKPGGTRSSLNSEKTKQNPSRPVENIQATRRGCDWSEDFAAVKSGSHPRCTNKSGRPERNGHFMRETLLNLAL
jgi:hypothetical protein